MTKWVVRIVIVLALPNGVRDLLGLIAPRREAGHD